MAVAILVATFANGAYGYLARLGVLDRPQFDAIVETWCAGDAPALACRCMRVEPGVDYSVKPWPSYLFDTSGYRIAFKLAKEFVFAGLFLYSLVALRQWRVGPQGLARAWPLWLFVLLVAAGFLRSAISGDILAASLGARPFEFAALALAGAWLTPFLRTFSRPLVWLLWLQLLLVVPEMLLGLPTRTCPNSFRAAGTLVLPNSLGVTVAVLLAFLAAFRPRVARNPWSWGAAIGLAFASGSGAGFVLLFILACWLAIERVPARQRWLAASGVVVLALGLLAALPALTQRPQVYQSLLSADGRVEKAWSVLRTASPVVALVGTGIGPGSNIAVNITRSSSPPVHRSFAARGEFYADSTVTMLLLPLGLAGVLSWFLLLGWGFARDRRARPFYLVAAVASLVINLPELFPANLLLGVVLAHTLVRTDALRRNKT